MVFHMKRQLDDDDVKIKSSRDIRVFREREKYRRRDEDRLTPGRLPGRTATEAMERRASHRILEICTCGESREICTCRTVTLKHTVSDW